MGPIKPGDRFYRVRFRGRRVDTDWIVVTSVGRRWASFVPEGSGLKHAPPGPGYRFDKDTMKLDGGAFTNRGSVYRDAEEYEWAVRDEKLWEHFRRALDRMYRKPDNVNDVAIFKAAEALGIKMERN